jgi:hypothetical protein
VYWILFEICPFRIGISVPQLPVKVIMERDSAGFFMAPEPTLRYPTLRRTRTALRVLAPILSATALLTGISMFAGVAPRLISVGYGPMERLIWAAIGLGYLIGAPIVAFALFFLLRAAADLIDLWVDGQVAAEKTADLVERQLVPGVLRMCQLLEKTNDSMAGLASPSVPSTATLPTSESRLKALDAVRDAVRRESWDQARHLASAFVAEFPDAPEAKDLTGQVAAASARKLQSLREQLDQAERANDCEGVLNLRDRLSAFVNGTELYQVDRRVAHWVARYLRESLAGGRAKEVIHLAERVVEAVGDTTQEGAQIRASLPTLRRSAGLCAECGQPSDVRLARCPACERKRVTAKATATKAVAPPV